MSYEIDIVSSSKEVLRAAVENLRSGEFKMQVFAEAQKALDSLKAHPSQIIIVDQNLQGMKSTKFLEQVQSISPRTVRILLMNAPDLDTATEVVNKGIAKKIVPLPWKNNQLLEVVKDALLLYQQIKVNMKAHDTVVEEQDELNKWDDLLKNNIKSRTRIILQKKTHLEQLNHQLEKNIYETIKVLFSYLEKKNRWIGTHSKKVAAFSVELAMELNYPAKAIEKIEIAAMLHDIGKIGIPDKIISKSPHLLSKQQMDKLKEHPVLGQKLLSPIYVMSDVGKIIRHHHEHWRGSGYPNGLKEEEIPVGSRIIAVANVFVNLLEKVHHRAKESTIKSLKDLISKSGDELDPDMVSTFLVLIEKKRKGGGGKRRQEIQIKLKGLKEGMMISRDILTTRGTTVLNKGTIIIKTQIDYIREFDRLEKIFNEIFIYVDKPMDEFEVPVEEDEKLEEDEF